MLGEYQNGTDSTEHVYLNGQPIAVIKNGTVYSVHTDHLGTPRAISDASQTVVWQWQNTDPFGATAANDDPDGDGRAFEYNKRFPGQYFDAETGRYITSDPIGIDGGINTYGYVDNNPLNWIDPLGLTGLKKQKKGEIMRDVGDLLDTTWCNIWPGACLFQCVRWKCSREGACGEKEYYFIGEGYPYVSSPSYDPDDDKNCVCEKQTVPPGPF